jgi:hypothetical protein
VVIVPGSATDAEIIAAVEEWLRLLEREDYATAAAEIVSPPGGIWTAEILRQCVNNHGYSDRRDSRVTLTGESREENIEGRVFVRTQRRDVVHFPAPDGGGDPREVWYDLYLDGVLSDLTATFGLERVPQGLALRLHDICVR